jgi:exodeoxyribonuclease VII large subunit
VAEYRQQLATRATGLDALSPLKVMVRGYSLVYQEDGKSLLRSVDEATTGDRVHIRLLDGTVTCEVESRTKNTVGNGE